MPCAQEYPLIGFVRQLLQVVSQVPHFLNLKAAKMLMFILSQFRLVIKAILYICFLHKNTLAFCQLFDLLFAHFSICFLHNFSFAFCMVFYYNNDRADL